MDVLHGVDWDIILTILLVVSIVALISAIIFRAIKLVIVLAIILTIGPILYNVVWGDGRETVGTVSSFFREDIKEQIVEGYDDYYEKGQENGIIDAAKVSEYVSNVFTDIQKDVFAPK